MAVTRIKNSGIKTGVLKYDSALGGYPPVMAAPTATAGNASASVAFTAATGATGYTVISTPGSFTGTGTTSPITVSGLSNGTAYTFQIRAENSVGNGAYSAASNSVTPALPNYSLALTANNTQNWTVPSGVTQIAVFVIGGGAGGNKIAGASGFPASGGAGAAYFKDYTVNAGQVYAITIGAGGAGGVSNTGNAIGQNGGTSSFAIGATTLAQGNGAQGGSGNVSNNPRAPGNGSSNVAGASTATGAAATAAASYNFNGTSQSGNPGLGGNALNISGSGLPSKTSGSAGSTGGAGGIKITDVNGTYSSNPGNGGVSNNGGGTGGNGGFANAGGNNGNANAGNAGNSATVPGASGASGGAGGLAAGNINSRDGLGGNGGDGAAGQVLVYTR